MAMSEYIFVETKNRAEKERLRKKLSRDVQSFLSSGGSITECEPRQDPKIRITKEWISKFTWKLKADQD